ncbi:hypothetical protein [Thermomonospora umbrina]|uniref:hypothetical protein n=1 Tax=Thermomonospora umbrina TaxID=111806 RepID=UPI000E25067C|nr:hypothetical protein [Thermomonospora umbrina]
MRFAFYGRAAWWDGVEMLVSRQRGECEALLWSGEEITSVFFDLGTPDTQHLVTVPVDFPIHRDGGLVDLLAEATRSDRRFDGVVVSSRGRLSTRGDTLSEIWAQLAAAGLGLRVADEPGAG